MKLSSNLNLFISLAKFQTILNRKFDSTLGGLGFNEFLIMYHLASARDGQLRCIDLASKVGLTASGVTRLLLPMEKVGYIKRHVNSQDARERFISLAPGGKTKLEEGVERAETFCSETIPSDFAKDIKKIGEVINSLTALIN